MNDSPAFQVPLVGSLGGIILWLLFFNVLLIGMVVFLAYRASVLRERLRELEEALRERAAQAVPPAAAARPLSDDRPIPTTRSPQA
jgi:hypothetical protein